MGRRNSTKKKEVVLRSPDPSSKDPNNKPSPIIPFDSLNAKKKEFRLFKLQNGLEGQDLEYHMSTASLKDKPKYHAISYSWGAPVPSRSLKEIKIDGWSVPVRPTLYRILQILAQRAPQEPIWTDYICVDQSNIPERNQQVSMMGKIYSFADTVYVWLGEGDADSDYVFDSVANEKNDDLPQFKQSAEVLFSRSYWTRMWVIQEFGLARKLLLVCGDKTVKWRKLAQSLESVEKDKTVECWKKFEAFSKVRASPFDRLLLDLVYDFREGRCQEKQDKVYSLRSLASDGQLMTVDYERPIAEIFFNLLSLCPPMATIEKFRSNDQAFESSVWGTIEFTSWIYPCLHLAPSDLALHLQDEDTDSLYLWSHRRGFLASLGSYKPEEERDFPTNRVKFRFQRTGGKKSDVYYTNQADAEDDDEVFSLIRDHDNILLIVRLDGPHHRIVDIAISSEILKTTIGHPRRIERLQLFREACLQDIKACSACNILHRDVYGLILWHISRPMLFQLYMIDHILQERIPDKIFDKVVSAYPHSFENDSNLQGPCGCEKADMIDLQSDPQKKTTYLLKGNVEYTKSKHGKGIGRRIYNRSSASRAQGLWRPPEKAYGSPLFLAVEDEDEKLVRLLVDQDGINTNQRRGDGITPLSCAVEGSHTEIAKILVEKSDVKSISRSIRARSPLTEAAENGNYEIVKLILGVEHVALNAKDVSGDTPLKAAVKHGHLKVVDLLLKQDGIQIKSKYRTGMQIKPKHRNGTQTKSKYRNEKSLLEMALDEGHVDIARLLLSHKRYPVNSKDVDDETALIWTVSAGYEDLVKLLLDRNDTKVNMSGREELTPLMWTAIKGFPRITRLLLGHKDTMVNLRDAKDQTALEIAAGLHEDEVVRLLLDHEGIKYDPKNIKSLIRKYKKQVGEPSPTRIQQESLNSEDEDDKTSEDDSFEDSLTEESADFSNAESSSSDSDSNDQTDFSNDDSESSEAGSRDDSSDYDRTTKRKKLPIDHRSKRDSINPRQHNRGRRTSHDGDDSSDDDDIAVNDSSTDLSDISDRQQKHHYGTGLKNFGRKLLRR